MPFSTLTLIKIALILDEENSVRSRSKRRRFWVHKMLKTRQEEGEFTTLYRQLAEDNLKFYKYFRMCQDEFINLLSYLKKDLTKKDTNFRKAITPSEKLAVCLRFLATGDSFQTIAFSYRLGHSTVHTIIQDVCKAIIDNLLTICIPTPQKTEWEAIANRFWTSWNFPNCLGAIDGKHIEIVAPSNSGSNYFNYKKTFSVVLLALVDADYRFVAVDIGSYGKNSDGGIFASSKLGNELRNDTLDVPGCKKLQGSEITAPHVIVGDSAFPLKTYLLRPYPEFQAQQDQEKNIFNYRLCRARRVVENAFGILAQRFRIYFRKINSAPGYIDNIILATCILHNYLRKDKILFLVENESQGEREEPIFTNIPCLGANARKEAFDTRNKFKTFFNSEAGSVPWQYEN